MDDSIRYTASEFVQLVTAGDQNISEFMSIEVDDDDTEKVVFRNVTEGWPNTDISRYVCFTSLGQHRNFCVTFKCDMSAQRAVPCFGLTNTTNRPFSIRNYLFMMETDIENYLGDNNKTWLRANDFGIYGYMSSDYSYAKRSDSNTFTLCKQGVKSWLWMDGELLVYQDLSSYGSSIDSYNIPAYLCMFWEWQNMNLDWVKIYDIEISMNDYDIDVSFDYNIFTPVGNLLTIDASKCTQQEGEIVSADWGGVADTLIHKEYIEDDKIIKCDLFGSKGGHFTYYLHCFVGNGVVRKQEILNDVLYDFRKNWQQYDPNRDRPSETAFLASLTSKCIITYKAWQPEQNPSALNFTHTLSDGLFSIDKGVNKNAQCHFSYNLVKNFKNLENQYGNYSQSEIHTYPANCIGIGLIWSRGTSYQQKFDLLMGHNLMLKDGTDFEHGENLDVWKNRYGEDFLATGENPKFVYSVACPIQSDRMKIDFVRHGDRFMVYRNNELIIEIKNKFFADLAPLHPTIYNIGYYSYESEYIYGIYHETSGVIIKEDEGGLSELLASSTSSPVIALMIESEALSEPICLYKGFKEVYLKDATETIRLFTPSGMTVQLPERKSGGGDALSFGLGDVSGQVLSICEQIRGSAKPAYVTLLQYLPFDEISNDSSNAPTPVYNLNLFVTGVAITTQGATISAGWHDTLNAKFPFRRYTAKEFPGLKYVTK